MDTEQLLLTEHLGFAPLSLIDEVINAVNTIMYTCTDALEVFLKKKRDIQIQELRNKSTVDSDVIMDNEDATNPEFRKKVLSLEAIENGTAEFETLLVSSVDRAFDKFELYTLRNILHIPHDLVSGGWIRLKHHEGLDLLVQADPLKDKEIKELMEKIDLELSLRRVLQLQKAKAVKLVLALKHYRSCVSAIVSLGPNSQLSPEKKSILREQLEPMNENLYYILGQVDSLLEQTFKLDRKLNGSLALSELRFQPTLRDIYMYHKSAKLLSEVGVLNDDGSKQLMYSATAEAQEHS